MEAREQCSHPILYKGLCGACGGKVAGRKPESGYSANFTASGGREVRVTAEEALRIEQNSLSALQELRKLSLVLDLDNTLLNTTMSTDYDEQKMKGTHELIMTDQWGKPQKYFVKLRPQLEYFLSELSPLYQMSIYTHGTRKYAEGTCKIMDPDGIYFGSRIVTRSDHPELGACKSLERMLKTDWRMVLIFDDRNDVWKGKQAEHLLCAKPFVHFDKMGNGAPVNNKPGILSYGLRTKERSCQREESESLSTKEENSISGQDDNDDDNNEGLVRAVSVFKSLHRKYFELVANANEDISIGDVLAETRSQVLEGCVICFSGVIPLEEKYPEKHMMWKIASSLGAKVESTVSESTTHLLAVTIGATKTNECLRRDDVFVLHCDWLLHCHWNVNREAESEYFLSNEHNPKLVDSKIEKHLLNWSKDKDIMTTLEENGHDLKRRRVNDIKSMTGDESDQSSDDEDFLKELEKDIDS